MSGQDFERQLEAALNSYFRNNRNDAGVAWRDTQSMYAGQKCDLLVDNPFLAIECKKAKTDNTAAIYFSQHFSGGKEKRHQVEKMSEFLERAGRVGYLAVKVSRGKGTTPWAFMIDWNEVKRRYRGDESGFKFDELKKDSENGEDYVVRIPREGSEWEITHEVFDFLI